MTDPLFIYNLYENFYIIDLPMLLEELKFCFGIKQNALSEVGS